eukprot:326498_1
MMIMNRNHHILYTQKHLFPLNLQSNLISEQPTIFLIKVKMLPIHRHRKLTAFIILAALCIASSVIICLIIASSIPFPITQNNSTSKQLLAVTDKIIAFERQLNDNKRFQFVKDNGELVTHQNDRPLDHVKYIKHTASELNEPAFQFDQDRRTYNIRPESYDTFSDWTGRGINGGQPFKIRLRGERGSTDTQIQDMILQKKANSERIELRVDPLFYEINWFLVPFQDLTSIDNNANHFVHKEGPVRLADFSINAGTVTMHMVAVNQRSERYLDKTEADPRIWTETSTRQQYEIMNNVGQLIRFDIQNGLKKVFALS